LCVKFFALWCKFNEKNRANKNLLNRNWLFKKGHWLKAIGICKRFWLHLKKNKRVIFHWCVIIDWIAEIHVKIELCIITASTNMKLLFITTLTLSVSVFCFQCVWQTFFLQGIMLFFLCFFHFCNLCRKIEFKKTVCLWSNRGVFKFFWAIFNEKQWNRVLG